jgi:DNA-binding MurR/RpiR family transcriptional regulator
MLLSLVGAVRARRARRDPVSEQRRGTRAARGRLAAAARLRATGTDGAFSEEVERAVTAFLEARLGAGLSGLTRDALRQRLMQAGAPTALVEDAARVLDTCDAVRFAPGAVRLDRAALLREAERVLEGWE